MPFLLTFSGFNCVLLNVQIFPELAFALDFVTLSISICLTDGGNISVCTYWNHITFNLQTLPADYVQLIMALLLSAAELIEGSRTA